MEKFPQPEQNKDFFAKREAQRKERDKETLDELQKTLPNESQEHLEQIFKEGEALIRIFGMENAEGDKWLLNGLKNATDRISETDLPLSAFIEFDIVYSEVAKASKENADEYIKILYESAQHTEGTKRLERVRALYEIRNILANVDGMGAFNKAFEPFLKEGQRPEDLIKELEKMGKKEEEKELEKQSWWAQFKKEISKK